MELACVMTILPYFFRSMQLCPLKKIFNILNNESILHEACFEKFFPRNMLVLIILIIFLRTSQLRT